MLLKFDDNTLLCLTYRSTVGLLARCNEVHFIHQLINLREIYSSFTQEVNCLGSY